MSAEYLSINGRNFPFSNFAPDADGKDSSSPYEKTLQTEGAAPEEMKLARFLREFFDPNDFVMVHTSGSTGAPKPFCAKKSRMRASARTTIAALGLMPGETNLLAMPLDYIAGKMVVVRSIECGLKLISVKPASNPFLDGRLLSSAPPDLCAVTPMQAKCILKDPRTREKFLGCSIILIGGGAVDDQLKSYLQAARGKAFATYGMTETLSHIALKALNGPEASQLGAKPLPGVHISLSSLGTLVIDAPAVTERPLVTNDLAVIHSDGTFSILGRLDNVINTGAVKIQAEAVEEKLRPLLHFRYAVSARRSEKYGEEVTLIIECAKSDLIGIDFTAIRSALGRFERPHWVATASELPLTETGKPARKALRKLAESPEALEWEALEVQSRSSG